MQKRRRYGALCAGLFTAAVIACVNPRPIPNAESKPAEPVAAAAKGGGDFRQVGQASWYGDWHQGRPTASGEAFDKNDMTAAHRTLPLDSRIRVTNLENGKAVTLRVNDRGPYKPKRILDVSAKAAEKLDMKDDGLARVHIEVVENRAAKYK